MVNSVNYNNNYSQYGGYGSHSQPNFKRAYYEEGKQEDNAPAKTAGLFVLLQGLALGVQKASEYFARKLTAPEEFTSAENVKTVVNDMLKKNKLSTSVEFIDDINKVKYHQYGGEIAQGIEEVAKGKNAFFHRGLDIAVAPKSKPSLMLHELGHAIQSRKGFIMPLLQRVKRFVPFAPNAVLIASQLTPSKDGKEGFIARNAGVLGFMSYIPILIEEAGASLKGIKAAKEKLVKLGKVADLNMLRRNLFFAWCTYLMGAVGMGIITKQTILENKRT